MAILPFLYILKLSLHRGLGGSKKAKTPLRKIKMVHAHCLKNKASNQDVFLKLDQCDTVQL